MDDVAALEAAHYVRDRVHFADVRQELIAESLALRGAGDQTCDVDKLDRGRHDLLGLRDRGQLRQARVRHGDHAEVWINGTERIILGRYLCARERVEQGRLADIGQTNDAAADRHAGTLA